MEFGFAYPQYLGFLFVIPLLILIHFISIRFSRRVALKFANFEALSRIKGLDLYSKNLSVLIISSLIVFLLAFSLAGFSITVERPASEYSYIVAIDSSQSMSATDLLPNRLEAAKATASYFVDTVPLSTKIGIVSFAGNSIIEQPVTDDKGLLRTAISTINITSIGGTDIGEVLITSVNALHTEENKAIILIGDGQINTGSLLEGLNYATRNNVIIHTIGIGTTLGGQTSYGLSKIDEDSLKSLAYNTKGTYHHIENEEGLNEALSNILVFEVRNVSINLAPYLLMIAILLFVLEFVLVNTTLRIYP